MVKENPGKGLKVSSEEFSAKIKRTDLNTYFIFGAIVLVLIVGMYAIFSPNTQDSKLGNPACGKIVIATDGPRLANNVSASLSGARFFLVVDPLSKKLLETVRNPYRNQQPNPQPDPRVVYLIAGKGEEAVIVGSIDDQSYKMLMQYGIRVFGGYEGQARKVISLYRQAKISRTTPVAADAGQTQDPQMGQAAAQVGFNQPGCVFTCPSCGGGMSGQAVGGICPNCQNYVQQGGMQGMNNMGNQDAFGGNQQLFICPNCNWRKYAQKDPTDEYPLCPNCGASMAQSGVAQGGMGMGQVNSGMNNLRAVNGMGGNLGNANQVAFGWGEQSFICPNCNWRLKSKNQGNSFPNCPNCNSPMAKDINANNGWQWWKEGAQTAANMTQLRPRMNQMTNQPNFWQGPESTKFFLCPNCNWRMYAQAGQNEYPKCPNCQQIMARTGAYPQNQDMQNNQAPGGFTDNAGFGTRVALQTPAAAPAITPDAAMVHPYRGVCSNCHQILGTQVGGQAGNAAMQNKNSTRVILGGSQNRR